MVGFPSEFNESVTSIVDVAGLLYHIQLSVEIDD